MTTLQYLRPNASLVYGTPLPLPPILSKLSLPSLTTPSQPTMEAQLNLESLLPDLFGPTATYQITPSTFWPPVSSQP